MNPTNPENSENGSKIRDFTTHSYTSNLQGCSRLHVDTANQTTTRGYHNTLAPLADKPRGSHMHYLGHRALANRS